MISVTAEMVRSWLPIRSRFSHKGDFGRVHILAGSVSFTGAPVFAAGSAVRTGSGLVFLSVPKEIWQVAAIKCSEAMPSPLPEEPLSYLIEKMNGSDAVLIGPGLGRSPETDSRTVALLPKIKPPLVLDADGINAVAGHIDVLCEREGRLTVLTPHDGEFSRLLGGRPVGEDRFAEAGNFARKTGCVLVLKGHRTITAFPDGELFVNSTGNPGMAKGGSGDVLAGMILSLLGQGIPAKQAIPGAVWLHGRAGDLCAAEKGEYGMTPTDMVEMIPYAMKF